MANLTSNKSLMTCLACAALDPGLRSILILDVGPDDLSQLAALLAEMLSATSGQEVKQHQLGPFESDDNVWGSLYLPSLDAEARALPAHRLFSTERSADPSHLQLITIPDLAALSLMAMRSITVLIGADVVHLERNGLSACWHPQECWLAACDSENIGKLSPHLLDRFALRISWRTLVSSEANDEAPAVARLLAHVPREPIQETITVPPDYLQLVKRAAQRQVEVSRTALAHVLEYIPAESYYPRREIVLARLARTLAQLSGAPSLQAGHIDSAAHMLGLSRRQTLPESEQEEREAPPLNSESVQEGAVSSPLEATTSSSISLLQEIAQPRTAQVPETIYTGLIESGTLCSNPHPEDGAPVEREEAALKLPLMRSALARSSQGAIVGVEESDSLQDLALVGTILAAARLQDARQDHYQRQHGETYPGLLLEQMDLRRYRRSHPIEQAFLLLLDYTSTRENSYWGEALIPYLRAAYIARAGILIVEVGAANAANPLRAEVIEAKNILVPRVGLALEAEPGRATPLAHGLSMAQEQLQRILQHGRNTAQKVTFVVISDGRGNVPLEASIRGEMKSIVTREGIDDALREARKIRALKHVETIVLNPQPTYYPDLPERLAEALGAVLLPISAPDQATEVQS
jgi:magnesium chelatase subunit D